jgi:hypothetical protein
MVCETGPQLFAFSNAVNDFDAAIPQGRANSTGYRRMIICHDDSKRHWIFRLMRLVGRISQIPGSIIGSATVVPNATISGI